MCIKTALKARAFSPTLTLTLTLSVPTSSSSCLASFLPSYPFGLLGGGEGKKGTTRSIAKVNTDPGGQLEASVQLARQLHNILYLMQNIKMQKSLFMSTSNSLTCLAARVN